MEKIARGLREFSALSGRKKAVVACAAALIVLLIVALCISINMRTHIQREYTQVRRQTGEALYSNLYMLTQTFDMTGVPNADVRNSVLPQMRTYYAASTTLNDLLGRAYGSRYAVLGETLQRDIDAAFSAYDAAFDSGSSTDLAESNMRACMDTIRDLLMSRYSDGVLRAAR